MPRGHRNCTLRNRNVRGSFPSPTSPEDEYVLPVRTPEIPFLPILSRDVPDRRFPSGSHLSAYIYAARTHKEIPDEWMPLSHNHRQRYLCPPGNGPRAFWKNSTLLKISGAGAENKIHIPPQKQFRYKCLPRILGLCSPGPFPFGFTGSRGRAHQKSILASQHGAVLKIAPVPIHIKGKRLSYCMSIARIILKGQMSGCKIRRVNPQSSSTEGSPFFSVLLNLICSIPENKHSLIPALLPET